MLIQVLDCHPNHAMFVRLFLYIIIIFYLETNCPTKLYLKYETVRMKKQKGIYQMKLIIDAEVLLNSINNDVDRKL